MNIVLDYLGNLWIGFDKLMLRHDLSTQPVDVLK